MFDFELLEDFSRYVLDLAHTRGRKKQYPKSVALHWKMNIFLALVLSDKQVEKYKMFSSMEDVKRMLRTFWFYVDKINALLVHVKSHIPCEFDGEDMWDPPSSNAMVPTTVLSLDK